MSSERTGFACGSLKPAVFFERSDGYVILAPAEKGRDDHARMVYETKYGPEGWQWREARTLSELDRLEKRLIAQEELAADAMIRANWRMRDVVKEAVTSALRRQMTSSETSAWERDFISSYLRLSESRRDKYRDALLHRNLGIMARNYDSSKKIEDIMVSDPSQFERG